MKKNDPKQVEISKTEIDSLAKNIQNTNLSDKEKEMLVTILQSVIWLNDMLRSKKLSIRKLLRLFGMKTEKQKRPEDKSKKNKDDRNDQNSNGNSSNNEGGGGHGKNGHSDYPGAKKVFYEHQELKHGSRCPECQSGNVYEQYPGVIINVTGSAPLAATVNLVQKLRCGTCGRIFTAATPDEVKNQKYDETADVVIGLMKYGLGTPFNRLSDLQQYLGIPLPPSTQWDRVEHLGDSIWPIYLELIKMAAQGDVSHIDDTTNRILDLTKQLKKDGANRMGIYTTAFISRVGEHFVKLFFTGNKHAGENLDHILQYRGKDLPPIIRMSDALSNNNPKEHTVLKCLCMTHGRRNFIDVGKERETESKYVISMLGKIYYHDKIALERHYSDEERLLYHQKKSGRVLKKLRRWFFKCFYTKKVEPNEDLGLAIQYMLNNWKGLTEFLRTPGAPLDNTAVERLIKRMILHRKNSLFFKSQLGAFVGDIIMSLIETCKTAGKNPFHYLVALHKNKNVIRKSPENFLPWNYEINLLGYHQM